MMTPLAPVMDSAFMDVYAFFVPLRLIWTHSAEFFGENKTSHWTPQVTYEIPQIAAPNGGFAVQSLAEKLDNFPINIGNCEQSHLPIRAYCLIWNEWFRSEAIQDPVHITMDETTVNGLNDNENWDYVTDTEKGGKLLKVNRYFDLFSSCLPEPQRGPDVTVPLGETAPILGKNIGAITDTDLVGKELYAAGYDAGSGTVGASIGALGVGGLDSGKAIGWVVDLQNATSATINQLRQAYSVQRYYEALARSGGRYISMVENLFGVTSSDARFVRPELAGARRFEINIDQVLQTSATDAVSPQGHTAAYSCTINAGNLATFSATEHGIWMVLGCIRTHRSYCQGFRKEWMLKKTTDFYVPQFAHLGEVAVNNKEIYAQGDNVVDSDGNIIDDQVFGYNEAWYWMRYRPSALRGYMRTNATGTLSYWNYGDKYTSLPHLSSDWLFEGKENVQRTLAVQNQPQWLINGYIKQKWTRVLPMYSIPGLQDHF